MTTAPCACCGTQIVLLELKARHCAFCGAELIRVGDAFQLAAVPPIESKAEIAARQQAVRALQGA